MKKLETIFCNETEDKWILPDSFDDNHSLILVRPESQFVFLNRHERDIYSPYSRVTKKFVRKPGENRLPYKVHLTTRMSWKKPDFKKELVVELRNLSPYAVANQSFDLGEKRGIVVPYGLVLWFWWDSPEQILNGASDYKLFETVDPQVKSRFDIEYGYVPEYGNIENREKRTGKEWDLLISARREIRKKEFEEKLPIYAHYSMHPEDEKGAREIEKRERFKEASEKSHDMFSPGKAK